MADQAHRDDLLAQRTELRQLAGELAADLREVERALAGVEHELAHLGLQMEADRSRGAPTEQEKRRPTTEAELEIQSRRSM